LMKLTGKRKIDETPAALHEAMESFAREVLARAEKVADWAEPAGFPRPAAFDEGKEALESVLALTAPVHRVKEVHARADDLKCGIEAIDQLSAFREKWGAAFTDLRSLAGQLRAIEHLLPPDGPSRRFLGEYQAAQSCARFAEPEIWKGIQGAKASAELELQSLLDAWREEARQIARGALERLPDDLRQGQLPEELAKELAAPLEGFVAAVDQETEPPRVAALPARAQRLVSQLGEVLHREVEKQTRPEERGKPAKPSRAVRAVRFSDVATVRRLCTEAEWDAVQKKLDERVRTLLRDFDVELD